MDTRLALAVKSFIVNDKDELLLVKREEEDVHCPGAWELPGGRLELGEDPFEALKRETKEETNIDIEVKNPLKVHHFTRDDGQDITMISFLCRPKSNSVVLSKEHTDYKWIEMEKAFSEIHEGFREEIELFKEKFLKK